MNWRNAKTYMDEKPYRPFELIALRLSAQIHYGGKIFYRKNLNPNDFEIQKLLKNPKFKIAYFYNRRGSRVAEVSKRWGVIWTARLKL